MDVELLVIADCPNGAPAATLLSRALAEVGLAGHPVRTRVITNRREAEQLGFIGSPTIHIDGQDPFADGDLQPGLSCRVYRSAAGLTGLPDIDLLRRALKRAADHV